MLSKLKRSIKASYTGISWQSPLVQSVLPFVDVADSGVRLLSGRGHLPRYSRRIRSNGVRGQFGGRKFAETGAGFVSLIRRIADLDPETDVLEVGCGCGRIALALDAHLEGGRYTGMDVDGVSIEACKHNPVLAEAGFHFLLMDVRSELYNPDGELTAREYVFPFSEEAFDLVLLHSVITHMLPEEVEHYIEEFGRIIRPGGVLVFSAFLADYGIGKGSLRFPYDHGSHRLHQERMPRKAVSYPLDYLDTVCTRKGMFRRRQALVGDWRCDASVTQDVELDKDLLLYERGPKGAALANFH